MIILLIYNFFGVAEMVANFFINRD